MAGRAADSFDRHSRTSASSSAGIGLFGEHRGRRRRRPGVVHQERQRLSRLERRPAREQPEGDAAERVDVGSSVERSLAGNQFGRKKRRRAENHAGLR